MKTDRVKAADKISIVMPVRNGLPYLEACLKSIFSQSFTNWELIIINDHSTDNTSFLLDEISKSDQRVQWHNNEGSGIIPALILGSTFCKGHMITRMDADDIMPKDKLENLYKLLKIKGQRTVVTGLVKYISQEKLREGFKKYESWLNRLSSEQCHYSEIYKECCVASANWLMYMDDFKKCGGFDVKMYPEDYSLVFEWRKEGYKISATQNITHLWRDHPQRASRNDDNYKNNSFAELKVIYFIEQDWQTNQSLILWGAGPKGKLIAKQLIERKVPFRWICNNTRKIGKHIYGVEMEIVDILSETPSCQVIIAVSQRGAKENILHILQEQNHQAFFFT